MLCKKSMAIDIRPIASALVAFWTLKPEVRTLSAVALRAPSYDALTQSTTYALLSAVEVCSCTFNVRITNRARNLWVLQNERFPDLLRAVGS